MNAMQFTGYLSEMDLEVKMKLFLLRHYNLLYYYRLRVTHSTFSSNIYILGRQFVTIYHLL